jgi:hypothetical protein
MTAQQRVSVKLSSSDMTALHEAWMRLERARAEREAALVALYHLASELGVLDGRRLTGTPENHDRDRPRPRLMTCFEI